MPSNKRLMKIAGIWFALTIVIMLSLLGILALTNYNRINDIEGLSCGEVGGRWVETTYQLICVVDRDTR